MICKQCGDCCKRLITKIRTENAVLIQFYKARGFEIKDGVVIIDTPHRCPQLTEDNKCKIQENKPLVCRISFCDGIRKDN